MVWGRETLRDGRLKVVDQCLTARRHAPPAARRSSGTGRATHDGAGSAASGIAFRTMVNKAVNKSLLLAYRCAHGTPHVGNEQHRMKNTTKSHMPLVGQLSQLLYAKLTPVCHQLDASVLPTLDLKVIWWVLLPLQEEYVLFPSKATSTSAPITTRGVPASQALGGQRHATLHSNTYSHDQTWSCMAVTAHPAQRNRSAL